MRIALVYPPPWQIVGPDELAEYTDDRLRVPFGLLSIAAQAMRAGHQVSTFNITDFPWNRVETIIRAAAAAVFGMYCNTPNRHGVAAVARLIREVHPAAHIVIGGPHATALPIEMLTHYPVIDTVVVGEGEDTFMDLLGRIEAGEPTAGIPGTAWHGADGPVAGPSRPLIRDLDRLASPLDYFRLPSVVTSRGCPAKCTFCGTENMWRGKLRYHSVNYVLDRFIEPAVRRYGMRHIGFKDDTFTANRKRILGVCRAIVERGLDFLWNCDTRVDCLDEEVLYAMRRAGCETISLGVESASRKILANIRKKTDPDGILQVTRMAKDLGFGVRYYMIYGNRGETLETFRESLDFIEEAKPNRTLFYPLAIYPGTEEFELSRGRGLDSERFFTSPAQFLTVFAGDARGAELDELNVLFPQYFGTREVWRYGVAERAAVLERLPGHHAAHADLAHALFETGRREEAEEHARRAMELGYPRPGNLADLLADVVDDDREEEDGQPHLPGPIRLGDGSGGTAELGGYVVAASTFADPDPLGTTLKRGVWQIVEQTLGRLSVDQAIAPLVDETAAFAATVAVSREATATLACRVGCDACCRFGDVTVTPIEALRIAEEICGAERTGVMGRIGREGGSCPFLDDGRCAIHRVRPFHCRARNSLDVEACRSIVSTDTTPASVPASIAHERPVLLAREGLRLGLRACGLDAAVLPLETAMTIALGDSGAAARWAAGGPLVSRRPGSAWSIRGGRPGCGRDWR